MNYSELFGKNTELGRWLASKKAMEKIGRDIFVHASISRELCSRRLSVGRVNRKMSRSLFLTKKERKEKSKLIKFLYGSKGPLWYRGMVVNKSRYCPLEYDDVLKILKRYKVKHIIVGHTIFKEVSTFHKGKVIGVNVDNKLNMKKKRSRGLLIDGEKYLLVGDEGPVKRISAEGKNW